ncbi:MAG: hypothetical protein Q7T33_09180 [Dehalococcoidia bacterium]|nr:hypothetical protein [Dehalococcoidia bacterium]
MSCVGELDKLDGAIFADTGWEPAAVYRHLEYLEAAAAAVGIPVYRVSAGNIRADMMRPDATVRGRVRDGARHTSLPFYTRDQSGAGGILKRQCTKEYKIAPIDREIRRLLGLKYRAPWPKEPVVELWMGISGDEQRRVRQSDARWKVHRYPLVFEKWMRRDDCKRWIGEHGFPIPPRSACLGCPFHSDAEWHEIKQDPEAWSDVTEFDMAIRRKGGVRGDLYLHRSCKPLVQVDLSTPEERGQRTFFETECLGYCGS